MVWIAVLAFGTLFLSHTAPFPFLLDKFAPSRSIWRMPHAGGPPTVYLTFDDGPNPTATPQLLDVLRETGATATFFLIDAHLTSETAPIVRRMFRPHAGWRSATMYQGLERIDHKLVGWTFGMWDFNWYRRRDALTLSERLARRVSPGDIIVMHDGHHVDPRPDRQYAVEATRRLVATLKPKGWVFGRLCDPLTAGC